MIQSLVQNLIKCGAVSLKSQIEGLHGAAQVNIVTSKRVVRRGLDVDVAGTVAPNVTTS